MTRPKGPPPPPDGSEQSDRPQQDEVAGGSPQVDDKRAEFERISRQQPRDAEAERAFVEGKIEMIRTDPNLSDEEKHRAIEEIRQRFHSRKREN